MKPNYLNVTPAQDDFDRIHFPSKFISKHYYDHIISANIETITIGNSLYLDFPVINSGILLEKFGFNIVRYETAAARFTELTIEVYNNINVSLQIDRKDIIGLSFNFPIGSSQPTDLISIFRDINLKEIDFMNITDQTIPGIRFTNINFTYDIGIEYLILARLQGKYFYS